MTRSKGADEDDWTLSGKLGLRHKEEYGDNICQDKYGDNPESRVHSQGLPHAWIIFSKQPPKTNGEATGILLALEPVDVSYVTELDKEQVRNCQWSTLDLYRGDSWTLVRILKWYGKPGFPTS